MPRLGPRRAGVLFASHALFSAVLAWVWLGESQHGWTLLGCALLVAGVMMAILLGRRSDESHHWEQTRGRLLVGVGGPTGAAATVPMSPRARSAGAAVLIGARGR